MVEREIVPTAPSEATAQRDRGQPGDSQGTQNILGSPVVFYRQMLESWGLKAAQSPAGTRLTWVFAVLCLLLPPHLNHPHIPSQMCNIFICWTGRVLLWDLAGLQ